VTDFDAKIFIYEIDPYFIEMYRSGCAKMNSIRQGFRKFVSDRHSDKQTDTIEIMCHAASRVVGQQLLFCSI